MLARSISPVPTLFQKAVLFMALKTRNRTVNPFPRKPLFLRVCSTSLFKKKTGKSRVISHFPMEFSTLSAIFRPFSPN